MSIGSSTQSLDVEDTSLPSIPESSSTRGSRKTRSAVWNDFTQITKEDGSRVAVCNHCKNEYANASRSGTTHLKNHYAICPTRLAKLAKAKSPEVRDGRPKLKPFKLDQEKGRLAYAQMVIKHEYPFSMVEHEYFKAFVYTIQPSFKLVSRNTVRSDIEQVYRNEKEKLYTYLENQNTRLSITTDMWTCDVQNMAYCSLTCHFIDEEWHLKKKIIGFEPVTGPHDALSLHSIILNLLVEWNIDSKLCSITVDNASTNDAMVRELKKTLCERNMLLMGGSFFHVRCNAHILNLVVHDGLEVVGKLLSKIRESVKYINLTPQRYHKFLNAKSQVKLEQLKNVSLDVPTRWNSTYLMLDSALPLRAAFSRLEQVDMNYKLNPSDDEWEMGDVVCKCLKTFYEATLTFSMTKYPTANVFFPEVCNTFLEILSWKDDNHDYVRSMAEKMLDKFKKYWRDCSLALEIASVFDPQLKMEFLMYYYSHIYGPEGAENVLATFRSILSDLFSQYSGPQPSESLNVMPNMGKKLKKFGNWFTMSRSGTYATKQKTELEMYLEEGIIQPDSNFDVLQWWRFNSTKYPVLAKMARDFLAIPISTVASESAFSSGGRIVDEKRSCLGPEMVRALICTQDWLEPLPCPLDVEEVEASTLGD